MSAVDEFLKSRTAAAPEDLPDDIPNMDSDYRAKHQRAAVYYPLIDNYAKEYPDVPDLASYAKAMMLRESGGNPGATSSADARGLLQLIPSTYAEMGGDPENAHDPVDNLKRGVAYIAKQYREYGDWNNALAAYNWGPGNVDRHGIDNLPPETDNYLKAVNGYRKRLQGTAAEAFFASKAGAQQGGTPAVGLGPTTDSFLASKMQDKPSLDGFKPGAINLFPNRQNVYNPPVDGPEPPPPDQPPIPYTQVPPSLLGYQPPKGDLLQPKVLDPAQVQGNTPIARPGSQDAYIPTPLAGFGKGLTGALTANGAAIPEAPGEAPYRLAGDLAGQFAVQAPPFMLGPEVGLPAAGAYQMLRSGNEQKTRNPNRPVDVAEAGSAGALGAAGAGLPAAAGKFLLTKMLTGAAFGGAQGVAGQAIDQLAEKGKIDLTDPQTWQSALKSAGVGAFFGAFHQGGFAEPKWTSFGLDPMTGKQPYRGNGIELTPENTPGFVQQVGQENPMGPQFQRRPDYVPQVQTPDAAQVPDQAPTPAPQGNEPWQMTSGRYNLITELSGKEAAKDAPAHYDLVKQAVEDGKPVPANVLAEYPNLTAPPAAPQAEVLHVGQYTRSALLADDGRTIRINPQDEQRLQLYQGQASNPDQMASSDKWRILGAPVKIDKNAPTLDDIAHSLNQKLRFEGKSAAEAAGQDAAVNTGRYVIAGADQPDRDYGYSADDLASALTNRPRNKEAMAAEIQDASKASPDYNVDEAEAFYRLPKEEQNRIMSQMEHERRTDFPGPQEEEWNPYMWDIPERKPEPASEPNKVIPFPEERTIEPWRADRVQRNPESDQPPRVYVSNRLQKVAEGIASGRITPDEARETMERLAETLDQNRVERQDANLARPRARGMDIIEEKLLAARRRGELNSEGVDLARWVMRQNPAMVDDLGISVRSMPGRSAGQYQGLSRIIEIAKHQENTQTVTHEIMHHTERMMPQEIRQGILQEYAKAWSRAFTNAPFKELKALELIARANNGDVRAQQGVMRGFGDGSIPRKMYQLSNPSEFWAVNSSRILSGRYQAQQRGWVAVARQWFKEFVQHLKASVGLKSDSAVIRGLRSVLRGDGEFVTNRHLAEHQHLERPLMSLSSKPEEAKGPQVGPQSQKVNDRFEKMIKRPGGGLDGIINYGAERLSNESGWQSRAERAYTWYVNEAEPLEKIGRIARRLGDTKLAAQLKYAVNRVLGSGGSANTYIKDRLFPIFQGGMLDGIKYEKLTPAEGRLVDAYALSKDTLWRLDHADGFDNPALTREHALELLREHDKLDPKTKFKVEQAAQGLTTYAKDLAVRKVEAKLPDWAPEKFKVITANPYYIPEIRDWESVLSKPKGKTAKRQFTSTNRLTRSNFGDDEVVPIFDPITSLVHDTHEFEAESAKMAVWNTVLEMSEKHPELKNWIRRKPKGYNTQNFEGEVPILRPRETHLEPDQIKKAEQYEKANEFLEKAKDREWQKQYIEQHQIRVHERINKLPLDRRAMLGEDMDQILKDVERRRDAWVEKTRVESEKIIDAFRKIPEAERYKMEDYLNEGKPQTWIVPKEVADAVNGIGPLEFVGLEKFIVNVASLFRRFQVGYNLDFSGANVPRDLQEAYINAKMPFWYAWKGLYHYIKQDDVYKAYMENGGSMEGDESGMRASADIGQNIRYGDRFLKDRYRRVFDKAPWEEKKLVMAFGREIAIPGQAARVGEAFKQTGKIALDASEIAAEAGEMMTRLAVMDYSMKKLKMDPAAAADQARQATLDFKRIGSKMKSWNARIPFLNARIQGMDRSFRNFKDDKWKAATRVAMTSVAPMVMLQAWNMRNPNYKDIPAWEKEYYWIIMDPHGQGYTKIAKGQVAQLLNPLQMVLENIAGTAHENGWQIASSWFANAAPVSEATGFVSPVEKMVLEENAGEGGYDFYTRRPIVKTPGARPADQWDANTPETLKKIGRAFNWSPQMMNHRLKSLFGGTAGNALFLTDLFLGHPPKDPAAIPIVRRFRGQTEEWKSDLAEQKRQLLHEKSMKEDALKSFKSEYMRAAKEPNPADLRRQISEKRKNTMKDLVDVLHKLGQTGSALDSLNNSVDSLNATED